MWFLVPSRGNECWRQHTNAAYELQFWVAHGCSAWGCQWRARRRDSTKCRRSSLYPKVKSKCPKLNSLKETCTGSQDAVSKVTAQAAMQQPAACSTRRCCRAWSHVKSAPNCMHEDMARRMGIGWWIHREKVLMATPDRPRTCVQASMCPAQLNLRCWRCTRAPGQLKDHTMQHRDGARAAAYPLHLVSGATQADDGGLNRYSKELMGVESSSSKTGRTLHPASWRRWECFRTFWGAITPSALPATMSTGTLISL